MGDCTLYSTIQYAADTSGNTALDNAITALRTARDFNADQRKADPVNNYEIFLRLAEHQHLDILGWLEQLQALTKA